MVEAMLANLCLILLLLTHNAISAEELKCGLNTRLEQVDSVTRIATGKDLAKGGNSGPVGSWPWMVSAGFMDELEGVWQHKCGGSIITRRHVLTAAHCAIDDNWQLRMGDRNVLSSSDDQQVVVLNIARTFVHPKYDGRKSYYDVALWQTDVKIEFNGFIRPICIPIGPNNDLNTYQGHFVTLTGWGLASRGVAHEDGVLKQVPLRVFNQGYCNRTHDPLNLLSAILRLRVQTTLPQLFQSNIFCAGYEVAGFGSCEGDSGGPIVRFSPDEPYDRYQQLGIVQGGVGTCGDGEHPGIYVRLEDNEVLAFIRNHIGAPKEQINVKSGDLINAALDGDALEVQHLILNGASILEKDNNGWTALHHAAERGYLEVAQVILEGDVKRTADEPQRLVNSKTSVGDTALSRASFHNHISLVDYLLEKGAKIAISDALGANALHIAIMEGHMEVVKLLLDSAKNASELIESRTKLSQTPLYLASRWGFTEIVRYILSETQANVDNLGYENKSSIYIASFYGHLDVVDLLIAAGADIDQGSINDQFTPLHAASQEGHSDVVKSLVLANAKVDLRARDGQTSLWSAASHGRVAVVRFLVRETKANVDTPDNVDNFTPINEASFKGHTAVVRELLTAEPDLEWASNSGLTPLHSAAFNGHSKIVELLIESNADPMTTLTSSGSTPLHSASSRGHLPAIKILVEEGQVDIEAKNNVGWTALHEASIAGFVEIVQYLMKKGANVNAKTTVGHFAPLMVAAQEGHLHVVEALIDGGAEIDAVADSGRSALMIAANEGHLEVVNKLIVKGADLHLEDALGKTALDLATERGFEEVEEAIRELVEKK